MRVRTRAREGRREGLQYPSPIPKLVGLCSLSLSVSGLKHPLCLEVRVKVKATLSAGMGVELGQT